MKNKFDLTVFYPGYTFYNYHFLDELNKLANDGFKIQIIFIRGIRSDSNFQKDHTLSANMKVMNCNFKGIRVNDYTLKTNFKLMMLIFKSVMQSRKILTSTQAPLHSKYAFVFSKILLREFSVVVEQWRDYCTNNFVMKAYKYFGYFIIRNSNKVFVHGASQREFALDDLRVKEKNVKVLPFLSRAPFIQGRGKDKDVVNVLYFGRVTEQKGLDILIKAFNKIKTSKKIKLLICGGVDKRFHWETIEANKYLDYCIELSKNNKKIEFFGEIPPSEKDSYFANSDIFVHPHKNFKDKNDGWGLVVNEALAYGLPIISTSKVGSATTLVKNNQNGYIVAPSSINELKAKLTILIENDMMRNGFSDYSFRVFDEYHNPKKINEVIHDFIRI